MALGPQTYQLIIFYWVLFAIATILVAIRLYVQFHFRAKPWSEILVICAWLMLLGTGIQISLENHWDWGNPNFNLNNLPHLDRLLKLNASTGIVFWFTLWFCKAALLCFYHGLTPRQHFPKTWWLITVTWGWVVAGMVYQLVFSLTACWHPWKEMWDMPQGHCLKVLIDLQVCTVVWHTFTDILVYTIPFIILRNLKPYLDPRKTRAAYVMFGVGLVNLLAFGVVISNILLDFYFYHANKQLYFSRAANDAIDFITGLDETSTVMIICLPQVRRLWLGLSREAMEPGIVQRIEEARTRLDLEAANAVADDEVKDKDLEVHKTASTPGVVTTKEASLSE